MLEQPVVSVCMITFNHEAYVVQAIEGVLIQKTSFPIELVIGEDCSNDRTREICIEYARKYPEIIRLLLNDRNIGIAPNFIQSFQACRGKYIALCEGDDYWVDPLKLQKQVDALEQNPIYSMTASNSFILHQDSQIISQADIDISEFTIQDLLKSNILGSATCSIMFRRDCISRFEIKALQEAPFGDWTLSLFCLKNSKGVYIKEPLCCYRVHKNGVWSGMSSADRVKNNLKMYDFIMRHFPEHKNTVLEFKESITSSVGQDQENTKAQLWNTLSAGILRKLNRIRLWP
jgi:glycosyltransferase involved in cell wall biosynthesis